MIAHVLLMHDESYGEPLLPLKEEIADGYLGKMRDELVVSTQSGKLYIICLYSESEMLYFSLFKVLRYILQTISI